MSITTVTAAGDVCLPTIGALSAELKNAFDAGTPVALDLSQATAPDLSVVQLVQSARATAQQTGAAFTLATPADATLSALLDRAGFTPSFSSEDRQFWFHGDTAQ